MKHFFAFLLFVFAFTFAHAQQDTTRYTYCIISGISKVNRQLQVQFDCGEGLFKAAKQEYPSMAAAMNEYAAQGWQFVAAYTEPGTVAMYYHWVVRKPEK